MRQWFSPAEIVAVGSVALPRTLDGLYRLIEREGWQADPRFARQRAGRGGGWEYHIARLPAEVAAALIAHAAAADAPPAPPTPMADDEERLGLWADFDARGDGAKREAARRLAIVRQVAALRRGGMGAVAATILVAREAKMPTSTLRDWLRRCQHLDPGDWLAALAPRHTGGMKTADCDPRAYEFLKADYLRPEQPCFIACHRRMVEAAAHHGWTPIPSAKTLQRRIEAEFPKGARVAARQGRDAAKRLFPSQRRDRSGFAALSAVNADGHKFDVFVRFDDGTIGRPVMVTVQDLYSGMILAHREDITENKDAIRLAFADVAHRYGIPDDAWLDNGRGFASKWITGRVPNRYRFTIRDEDPAGILPQLGINVHWTKPYSGQSKPIERAFRDLCEEVAKHPALAGCYVGNRPDAKPENYGSRAVSFDAFKAIVAAEIERHNARPGRRGGNANGRSFADTHRAGLETAIVRRASEQQLRMLLLAAEGVPTDRRNGEITFAKNRYWAHELVDHAGEKVVVRFDPEHFQAPLAVYSLTGQFIVDAHCIAATGFTDATAAREHERRRNAWLKAQRDLLAAERRMTIEEVAALMPLAAPTPEPETKVIRLVANGAPREVAGPDEAAVAERFSRGMARLFGDAEIVPFGKENGGRG